MRKTICALSLLGALVLASAVNAAAPTSFAGTWALDKSKSQGLSSRDQGADSVSWTITQTDKEITIEQKVTGGAMASGGGPGGPGGGGRGGGMGGGPRTYNLDGSETTADMGRGKAVRKASWSKDGKTLELSSKSTFQGQDGAEVTSTSNDKMQLSGDGKTLTVIRHSESPRGTQDTTYVFTKQ
jgi:hypothetical protein